MCEAVSPTFWATSTNLGGGPAPGRACARTARGGGAAVGPMAAGVWGAPLCAFCGAGFCADTSAARTEIKRKAHAASLAGLRGMNAAILAQLRVGTGVLACPGERSSPPAPARVAFECVEAGLRPAWTGRRPVPTQTSSHTDKPCEIGAIRVDPRRRSFDWPRLTVETLLATSPRRNKLRLYRCVLCTCALASADSLAGSKLQITNYKFLNPLRSRR